MNNLKQWGSWFVLLCKRYWKMPRIWLLSGFCMVILLLFQTLVFSGPDTRRYGIYDAGTVHAKEIIKTLRDSDGPYDPIVYHSRSELERKIESGYLDCGFVLTPALDNVTNIQELAGTVDYVISTSTQKGLLIKEHVLAALLETASRASLLETASDGTFLDPSEQLNDDLLTTYEDLLHSDSVLQVSFQTVDTSGQATEGLSDNEVSSAKKLRTLCAILLFAAALVFAVTRFSRETTALRKVLHGKDRPIWIFLSVYAPTLLLSLLLGIAYPLLLRRSAPWEVSLSGTVSTFFLLLVCGLLSALWSTLYSALFRKNAGYLTSLIGVLLLGILSNATLIPAAALVPALRVFRYLYPFLIIL